jgi:Zn-dependent protease with chaperone function/uncharacterized tellurite resistance protein B-like protein
MRPEIAAIQARRDRELRSELVADRGVTRALARFEDRASGWGFRQRRALLAEAIRLNRRMAPQVAEALADCRAALGFDLPVEIYLRPEPVYNAFCSRGRAGPLVIGFSSRLLDEFDEGELRFVLGHEIGHALYDHFGIPMPITATIEDVGGTLVSRSVQLRLFVWCRAAEVSADRAGLLCCRDPQVGATAFFKLASGLARPSVQSDLDAFAAQIDSLASTPSAMNERVSDDDTLDCFSTHPYTPVRVRALVAFGRSRAFKSLMGGAPASDGLTDDEVEQVVERDLSLMEPSYLEERTAESERMRRGLYCAGIAVAAAHGDVSAPEIGALRALLGAREAVAPSDTRAVIEELDRLIGELASSSLARRAQLIQHLTVIAGADGHVAEEEYAVMADIATRLDVPQEIIDQTLRAAAAPMD